MPRGRENSRARIGASAIRPLEYFPYGLASPAQGGKQEANGGKLAFIRAVQAFTCHRGVSAAFQLYSSSFSVHSTGSLVLS